MGMYLCQKIRQMTSIDKDSMNSNRWIFRTNKLKWRFTQARNLGEGPYCRAVFGIPA